MKGSSLLRQSAPFAIVFVVLAYLLVQRMSTPDLGLPLDDAWIHAAYARSIADGQPFQLHAGDEVSPGSSAPLWTILLAPLHMLAAATGASAHATAVIAALVLGLSCAIGAAYLLRALLRTLQVEEPWCTGALFVFAFTPRWVWGTISGLEVALYTALVIAALAAHVAAKATGRSSRIALPLAVLAGWSRPELFVMPLILCLDAWVFPARSERSDTRAPRACGKFAIVAAALLAALYAGGHYLLYQRFLPTTFYVKAGFASPSAALADGDLLRAIAMASEQAWHQLVASFAFFPTQALFLTPFLCLGAVSLWRSPTRAGTAVLWMAICFPLLQGAVKFHYPENQVGRYLWHQYVPYLVLAIVGLQSTLRPRTAWPSRGAQRRSLAIAMLVLLVGGAACYGAFYLLRTTPPGAFLATLYFVLWNAIDRQLLDQVFTFYTQTSGAIALLIFMLACGGFAIARFTSRTFLHWFAGTAMVLALLFAIGSNVPIAQLAARNVEETEAVSVASGLWLAENAAPTDLVALHDLGAISYFASCRVLDLQGIGSPRVLRVPRGVDGRRDLAPLLIEERPRFYAGFLEWHQQDLLHIAPALQRIPGPEQFRANFQLTDTVTLGGTNFVILELPW